MNTDFPPWGTAPHSCRRHAYTHLSLAARFDVFSVQFWGKPSTAQRASEGRSSSPSLRSGCGRSTFRCARRSWLVPLRSPRRAATLRYAPGSGPLRCRASLRARTAP